MMFLFGLNNYLVWLVSDVFTARNLVTKTLTMFTKNIKLAWKKNGLIALLKSELRVMKIKNDIPKFETNTKTNHTTINRLVI